MQIFSSLTLQTAIRRTGYILRGRSGAAGVKNAEIQAAPMHANRTAVRANVGANLYIPSTGSTQIILLLLDFFGSSDILLPKISGSSSFCKGPRTRRVRGPL